MFKSDVLCIGSATVDRFLTIDQPLSSVRIGDKILATSMEIHSGGGGTNSAVSLAKLGLNVKILSKLGNGHDAEFIQKELKEYKINNLCQHLSKNNTDYATLINSTKEKDRIIYVHKGASSELSLYDFKKSKLKTKWIYLASLVGKSFSTAKEIVKLTRNKNVNVLFNPSLYLAKKGKRYLKEVLKATNILVLNKEEAQALLNKNNSSFKNSLLSLHELGPGMVIITNGTKKLYAYFENNIYSLLPPNVKPIHTAGAGDAFTSAFLAGMIKKYSFEDSLRLGQVNATSVIQGIGTKNGLLSERKAKMLIKKYNINVRVKKC